jgi:hypothetical protein
VNRAKADALGGIKPYLTEHGNRSGEPLRHQRQAQKLEHATQRHVQQQEHKAAGEGGRSNKKHEQRDFFCGLKKGASLAFVWFPEIENLLLEISSSHLK